MIRIRITADAFAAIERLLPGTVGVEREANEKGEREIWREPPLSDAMKDFAAKHGTAKRS